MLDYIQKIFNDDNLYGHFLTSLPSPLWNFTTSDNNLLTYTTPDPGSAERVFLIFEKYTKTERYPHGSIKSLRYGTNILPLKYAELGFRRIVGTCLTAITIITAVPVGFAIKIIHKNIKVTDLQEETLYQS